MSNQQAAAKMWL